MESYLRSPPPLAHAAAFFLRMKGTSLEDGALAKIAFDAAGLAPAPSSPAVDEALPHSPTIPTEHDADAVEELGASAYYKQKMQESLAELQAHQEASAQTNAELEALRSELEQQNAQAAQYQQMVSDATQQASLTRDQLLQEQQAGAAMRMAYQQLRGELLHAASREPPTTQALTDMAPEASGAMGGAAPAQPPSASPPTPATGPAAQAPAAPADPQAPGPEGDANATARPEGPNPNEGPRGTTHVSIKQGGVARGLAARLPYAAVGAGLGGLAELAASARGNDALRAKVQALEGRGTERTLGEAINLAQAKARLAFGELEEQHPRASLLSGMALGALTGSEVGPEVIENLKATADALRRARRL